MIPLSCAKSKSTNQEPNADAESENEDRDGKRGHRQARPGRNATSESRVECGPDSARHRENHAAAHDNGAALSVDHEKM